MDTGVTLWVPHTSPKLPLRRKQSAVDSDWPSDHSGPATGQLSGLGYTRLAEICFVLLTNRVTCFEECFVYGHYLESIQQQLGTTVLSSEHRNGSCYNMIPSPQLWTSLGGCIGL